MKYTKNFKKYIVNLVRNVRISLLLELQKITISFSEENDERDTETDITYASISNNSEYLDNMIYINPEVQRMFNNQKYYEIGEIIVHELCHIYFHPLWKKIKSDITENNKEYYNSILETQVTMLTRALMNILPKNFYLPKNNL